MWLLRKLYAGNGGVLPPTDPRILSMTPLQVEIELEHFLIDKEEKKKAEKGTEEYEDQEFDNYDKETDEVDDRLFWEPGGNGKVEYVEPKKPSVTIDLPKTSEISQKTGDWVDVEIDDDEDW